MGTDDFKVCSCIATSHPLHEPGECDEPPTIRGGICTTCRYAEWNPGKPNDKQDDQ